MIQYSYRTTEALQGRAEYSNRNILEENLTKNAINALKNGINGENMPETGRNVPKMA
jgi:hypothetical protein